MSKNNDSTSALSVMLSINEVSTENFAKDLEGFTFAPSDGLPFITIDKQRRFYFNSTMQRLFELEPYDRIAIGYNSDTESLAIVTAEAEEFGKLAIFSYVIDKRYYASAKRFVKDFLIDTSDAPLTYVFDKRTSVKGVYLFRRTR